MQKFDDNKNIKTYKDKKLMSRLYKYFRPHLTIFIISILLNVWHSTPHI